MNFDEKSNDFKWSLTSTSAPRIVNVLAKKKKEGMRKTFQIPHKTSDIIEEVDDISSRSNQSKCDENILNSKKRVKLSLKK